MKKIRLINTQLVWVKWETTVTVTEEQFELIQNGDMDLSELDLNYGDPEFYDCEENEFKWEEK